MNRITEGQLKKIIAAILAVLLTLFGMLPIMNTSGATSDSVFAAESASGTEPNLSGSAKGEGSVDTSGRLTLIDNDFENNLDGIGLSGEGFEKRKSPNGTNALALDTDQNGDKRIGSVSQKPLPKGRYRITFDYYAEKRDNKIYVGKADDIITYKETGSKASVVIPYMFVGWSREIFVYKQGF